MAQNITKQVAVNAAAIANAKNPSKISSKESLDATDKVLVVAADGSFRRVDKTLFYEQVEGIAAETKAALDAITPVPTNGAVYSVVADPTPANNGKYRFKDGVAVRYSGLGLTEADKALSIEKQNPNYVTSELANRIRNTIFQPNATFVIDRAGYIGNTDASDMKKFLLDIELIGFDRTKKYSLYEIKRNLAGVWAITIYEDTGDGSGANKASLLGWSTTTNPEGTNGISKIDFQSSTTLRRMILTVNWNAFTTNTNPSSFTYNAAGISASKINDFTLSNNTEKKPILKKTSVINTNLKDKFLSALKKVEIVDPLGLYTDFHFNDIYADYSSPASYYQIRVFAKNSAGNIVRVAQFLEINAAKDISEYETIQLTQYENSGVYGELIVDWSEIYKLRLTESGESVTSNTFKIQNVDVKQILIATDKTAKYKDVTIDNTTARLRFSKKFGQKNHKETLFIICHGNTGNHEYRPNLAFINAYAEYGFTYACIAVQEETVPTFTTDKLGWGNYSHYNRQVQLYKYVMDNYGDYFQKSVIVLGASMGMLAAGQLMYKKPFPIMFGISLGGVPDLSYIWGSTNNRKPAIRAAYGMAEDGSDDANIEQFIQGRDWYDMGRVVSTTNTYKVGFANLYMYLGTGEPVGTVEFGGMPKYNEIRDSLKAAGVIATTQEFPTYGHADERLYDAVLADGVVEIELGLK